MLRLVREGWVTYDRLDSLSIDDVYLMNRTLDELSNLDVLRARQMKDRRR